MILRLRTHRSINADGFGVGWYDQDQTTQGPCIFRTFKSHLREDPVLKVLFESTGSITPAWSNLNLHRLADKIKSPLVFAHVRASTTGALSEENTSVALLVSCLAPARGQADFGSLCSHPWTYANLIWMHNGCIADFHKIKRRLQNDLSDEMFSVPQGNTDSEWSFALFLDQLAQVTSHLHSSES